MMRCIASGFIALAMVVECMPALAEEAQRTSASGWKVGTPIVTYWASPALTDALAQQMSEGGWNLVWTRSEEELDVAQRHGLRAQFHNDLISPATLDNPEERKKLDALVNRVRKHPALYDYFITDEPSVAAYGDLAKIVAYLREHDPEHMAYINLFPCNATTTQLGTKGDIVTAYREYLRQYFDVVKPSLLSYDHYQFTIAGDTDQYFLNLSMIREAAQKADVPFLNIVQASVTLPIMRMPTCDELRYLTYTTLAYGAQGISHFVYCLPGLRGGVALPDGTPTPLYHTLKTVNREFVAIATELQPLRSLAIYHAGMTPIGTQPLPKDAPFRFDPPIAHRGRWPMQRMKGMLVGYFGPTVGEASGKPTHALAVNLDCKAEGNTTLIGPGKLEIYDALKKTWTPVGSERAALHLPPGGGMLVRLVSKAHE